MEHYLEFYRHLDDHVMPQLPFLTREPKRYVFAEAYCPGESLYGTAGYRLMTKKNQPGYDSLYFMRRTGYVADFAALRQGRFVPSHYYMFLERPPERVFPEVMELPAGEYLCFRCPILTPEPDLSGLEKFLQNLPEGSLTLANECEYSLDDSLDAYSRSCFEVQILL